MNNNYVFYKDEMPDSELMEDTIRKMEMLEKELGEKKSKKLKIVKKALLTAAVIALVITVTPMRKYVASAAANAYNAFHSWMEDVFHVGKVKSENGCSIEIIEARVSNDFLYLTVDENFDKLLSKHREKTYDDIYAVYYGTIKDNKGNSIDFSTKDVSSYCYAPDIVTSNKKYVSSVEKNTNYYDKNYNESIITSNCYKVYLPKLRDLINSYDKKYTCEVQVKVYWLDENYQYDEEYYDISKNLNPNIFLNKDNLICDSITFKFGIQNIDSVMQTKEYISDYSVTFANVEFKFEKMYVSPAESSILVEIVPKNIDISKLKPHITLNVPKNERKKYVSNDNGNYTMSFDNDYKIYNVDSRYFTSLTLVGYDFNDFEAPHEFEFAILDYDTICTDGICHYDGSFTMYKSCIYKNLPDIEVDFEKYNSADAVKVNKIVDLGEFCLDLDKVILQSSNDESYNDDLTLDDLTFYFNLSEKDYQAGICRWEPKIIDVDLIVESKDEQTHIIKITNDRADACSCGEDTLYNGEEIGHYYKYLLDDYTIIPQQDIIEKYDAKKIIIASINYTACNEGDISDTIYHLVNPKYKDLIEVSSEPTLDKLDHVFFTAAQ